MEHAATLVLISSKSKISSSSSPSGFSLRPNYQICAVLVTSRLDSREGTIFPDQMKFRNKELIFFKWKRRLNRMLMK